MRKQLILVLLLPGLLWAQPTTLESEARRTEQLYVRQDPGFGEALQSLRDRFGGQPSPWLSYLDACDSLLHQNPQQASRSVLLALSQKQASDQLKMSWLRQLARRSVNLWPDCLRLCIDQARILQRSHPQDDAMLVGWLEIQGYEAVERGLVDLAESLHRSRWDLCARHHWLEEQIRVGRQLQMDWDTLQALALSAPPGRRREEMLLGLLDLTPDASRWQKAMAALNKVPKQELLEHQCRASQLRAARWMPKRQADDYALRLLSIYQSQGKLEKEIQLRLDWAAQRRWSDPEQADRQRRAALQLRRDHPQSDPAYSPKRSLAAIGQEHAHYLEMKGRLYQALSQLEESLQGPPSELLEAHALAARLAAGVLDSERQSRHERAQLELLEKLQPSDQAEWLGRLVERLAGSRAGLLLAYEPVMRSQLRANLAGAERVRLLDSLSSMLSSKKDEPGKYQLYQDELQRAQSNGDQVGMRWAQLQLLRYYEDHRQVREWKELATPLLQDAKLRPQVLERSWWLAYRGEPEALVWAEDNVRMCKQLRDRVGLAWALFIRAYAQLEMKRPAGALKDLLEAETLPGGANRISVIAARARALHDLQRPLEAQQLLHETIEAGWKKQDLQVERLLGPLVEYRRELGEEWEREYETSLGQLEPMGPDGHRVGQQLLYQWLVWLAKDEKWDRGCEVLSQHPWDLPADDPRSNRLRLFEPWKDRFGTPATSQASEKGDGLAARVDELRLAHPELGQTLTLRSTNLPTLRKHLNANETLVTYCVLEDELVVLALRAGEGNWTTSRVSADAVARLIQDYLAGLRADESTQAERTLFSLLLEPVLQKDPNQRLLVVPSGPLWQLPWGALRDPQGQAAAGRAEIVLLSSGDLLRLADNSWQPYRLSAPLAIGAPPAADLPGAEMELREVSAVLPDCQLRSGAQATLAALRQADKPWGLVHFASHAHYNRKQPTESDIELSDGNLRLKQLHQLALAEHSLVALSCCQGGEAKGQALDEPVTLATGFSAAGAETVVGNLWRVDDEVARIFFVAFYRELARGASPLSSFGQAQSQTRKLYPRRRDWGGFFLLGNPS